MVKKSLLIMMLLAVFAPWAAMAQTPSVTIGSGTATSAYLPGYNFYNYAISQQIYTAEEINASGTITSISFYKDGTENSNGSRKFDIYMAHTTKTGFEASTTTTKDWIALTDADIVYHGTANYSFTNNAWNTFTLETPFNYNGTDNLVVCVIDRTGNCSSSSSYANQYRVFSTGSEYQAIYKYNDNYSSLTPDGHNGTTVIDYSRMTSKNQIILGGIHQTCAKPTDLTATLDATDHTIATLSWTENGEATSWVLQVATNNTFTEGLSSYNVSGTSSKDLSGLTPETVYYARVRPTCSETLWSDVCSFWPTATVPVVVNNGTTTNSYVPFYGYYVNKTPNRSQFIISAADMTENINIGSTLKKMTFHGSTTTNTTFGTATFKFYLKEVDNATFASAEFVDWESLTEVYSGAVSYNNKEMEITFEDDFIYNGGNLLVGVTIDQTNSSTSTSVSWYGTNGSGSNSIYNYMGYSSQTGPSLSAFMPKLTFRVIQAEVSCEKPQNLAVSGVTATGANFTWDAEDGATWQYCTFVLPHAAPTDADFTSETTYNSLSWNNAFAPNTNNIFYLRKKCGENDFSQPVSVTFNTLQAITNLTCTGYTATTATLGWTDNVYGVNSWQIMLNDDENNLIPVNTNPYTIENLTSETIYTAKVRAACANCPGGWSDWSSAVSFEPTAKQVIGSGTLSNNGNLPFQGNYDYSYTQQIYTVDELGEPGVIESIDFYMTSTSNKTRTLDVYMVTTDKSSFTGTTDWIAVTEADKVFSGNVTFQPAAWTSITLDNGFIYNGTQNIAIIVDDNSGNYTGGTRNFRTYTASATQSHYGFQDTYDINPSSPGSPSNNSTTTAKNQIRILKSEIPSCFPPTGLTVVANSVTAHNASLTWDAEDGATWQYRLIANPDETLPEDGFTETTEASKDYTNLTPETNYGFYLRKKCGENEFSTVVHKTFTTGIACFAPTGLAVVPNSITNHTASVNWTGTSDSYVVSYRTAADNNHSMINEDFTGLTSGIPTGWDNSEGTTTYADYKWKYYNDGHEAAPCLRFDSYNNSNGYTNFLKTPSKDFPAGKTMQLSFWWKNPAGGDFSVYISTDGGTTKTALKTGLTGQSTWKQETITLTDYVGASNVTIHFKGTSNYGSSGAYIYLDDVQIGEEIPAGEWLTVSPEPEEAPVTLTGLLAETKYEAKVKGNCGEEGYSQETASIFFTTDIPCPAPTNFTHSNVKSNSVDLSWEDNAEAWQICVNDATTYIDIDTDDVTIAQGVITYTLEGLEPTTSYTVKVRANCGVEDGFSDWTDEESFTTDNACPTPQNLIVVEGSETSQGATLTWTGENDSFDVELGAPDYTATPTIVTLTTEGFESTSMPTGWVHIGNGTGAPAASNPHTNSYSLKFNGATANNVVVLPEFEMEANTLTIDFWSKAEGSSSGSFDLGYVTEATDVSTFVALDTYTSSQHSSYTHIENYSMANAPAGARIAFRHRSGSTAWYWFIDDVTIKGPEYPLVWSPVSTVANENNTGTYIFTTLQPETTYMARVVGKCGNNTGDPSDVVSFTTIEACPAPANFNLVSTTSNSATFSWTQRNGITEWIVKYKKSTDTEYPTTYTTVQNTPSTTINNLEVNTDYDVQIFAACDTEFEQPLEGSFATDCDVITIAQGSTYSYDFESEAKWRCWTNVAGDNKPTTGSSNNNITSSGTTKLHFKGTTTGNIVAMPAFTPDINGLMLTFWTRPEGYTYTNCGTFSVGYMTDLADASTFVAVATYNYNDWTSNTYVEKKVAFTGAPAGAYIAFCHNAGSTNYYWFVDDVTVELVPTFTKTIERYADHGYYLIASPINGQVNPENVTNMTANDFALYRFDQTENNEWQNYKANSFNLANGQGYLYANSANVTLTFTGAPLTETSMEVPLVYDANAEFDGLNLVGNPFPVVAYINKDAYTLPENASEGSVELFAIEAGNPIQVMEGVFVVATEDENDQSVTFTTEAPAKSQNLNLNLTQGQGLIDRAIVRFGEGSQLRKFQLFGNHTKVYIPQNGKDYAVVSAEAAGEMPVNFKAEENGTYTLSFTNEEVTFSYLHLIDNLTGNDIDLLQTPSYTFNATTTDYSSRFKLVFCTGVNNDSDNFAFFSNSNWVIGNEGEATLQVVDVTGRILSSETVNGSVSKAINAAPGVYMLRLINGENVKVQKIVVK